MKKLTLEAFSATVFTRDEFTTTNVDKFHLVEKLLVTNNKKEPIMIANIFTVGKKHSDLIVIAFVWKDLIKEALTCKIKESFGIEKEFIVNFLGKGLEKIGIRDEDELTKKFPNTKEIIILLNNTNRTVDITIPDEMSTPKVFSSV